MRTFFNIDRMEGGVERKLGEGITATLFVGDQAMISVVRVAPDTMGTLHHHEEEQWGYLVEGSITRFQGDETVEARPGDFWRTPSNVPHTIRSGPQGAVIFDVFAPPRKAYLEPGEGFGS